MFNRSNKATALLLAAAAVVSLVPATGVSAADYKRVEAKDGTVYNAVAYKDGKMYIDGDLEDKDEAVYFLNDGKYTELEDIDVDSDATIYGDKYANVNEGEYFVDLTNGKVTDDDIKDENFDDASLALRRKVKYKTDDRYDETNAGITRSDAEENLVTNETMKQLPGNKFGETWYETKVVAADSSKVNASNLTVFTDAKGNYIDADYNLGEIRVESTTGNSVKIKNTNDSEKLGTVKDAVSAKIQAGNVLGQDSKNIYRTAKITITAKTGVTIKEIYGIKMENTVFAGETISFDVIQKISKEKASSDIDGVSYAKSVTNYVVSKDNGEAIASDSLLKDYLDGNTNVKFTVVDGKLVSYLVDEAKDQVKTQTIVLSKGDRSLYHTDILDESKDDVEKKDKYALEVDIDGNLWRLDSGYIYKWDNDEDWTKVYRVDGSMNELSVYDKDNMVVWNEKDEAYSIIGEKEESTEETKPEVTTGWVKNSDGTWTFVKEDGTKAIGWLNNNGTWYFSNAAGIMQTGWINDNGTWYYTNASGAMLTGWQNVNGTWYFMQGSGAMKTGWLNDNGTWYYTNASGAMQTGWLNDNGTWYYLDGSGKMLSNTTVNGYVLGANGAWIR
ncbi:N-acetylmuramoyl-L-alanine amidase family protein [Clostridium sp. ZBS15]|uniref:N-acetylmuramoyl-L-alanine amidase family protein n=1 Tax=Clostridium sp. ZBS15 TaxID=2949969 RepID=UPI00207A05ED|nr:N-acetylmuramoyl-L-alanine amidase family protein [Clostridium sp. ZBS15]